MFRACLQNHDWVPAIASGLFIGVKKGLLTFSTEQLRVVLAVAVLALPVVNVLIQKQKHDWVRSNNLQTFRNSAMLDTHAALQLPQRFV